MSFQVAMSRLRRNRQSSAIRLLCQETILVPSDFIAPLFVKEELEEKEMVPFLPGVFRFSLNALLREAESLHKMGISSIALFPVIPKEKKSWKGDEALNPSGVIPKALRLLKKEIPSLCLIADVALDPYTSHGHDGVVLEDGMVDNDETLAILEKQACLYAQSGADLVAPSATMDGRVRAIRSMLDREGLDSTAILCYTAKYASSLYGPFRSAIETSLQFGDKKSYQLNPANRREALREASISSAEGADMLLVKPSLPYLDVLAAIKETTLLPVGAYQVSGEYAMVMAGAQNGYFRKEEVFYEFAISMKRAGACFIVTYGAKLIASLLN